MQQGTTARAVHGAPTPTARARLEVRWLLPDEAPAFADVYARRSGLRTSPGEALGDVRGFFRDGVMVAGYRLGRTATRYAALVGAEAAARWPFDPAEAAEISHLWMDPLLDPDARRAVYSAMLTDLLGTGRRTIVGGTVDPVTRQSQMASLPWLLEEKVLEGVLAAPTTAWFYYGTPATMVANAMRMGVPVPWLGLLR